MVREVSEDHMYDTIEFNEFLQMMSKQQKKGLSQDILKDAFRIFDKDDDGLISVEELRSIMKNLGDKMTDEELDEMLDAADTKHDGLVNYTGTILVLCWVDNDLRPLVQELIQAHLWLDQFRSD